MYVLFLEALAQARDVVSHASQEVDLPDAERAQLVRTVIKDYRVYTRQYELELIAPPPAVTKAKDAAWKLALYRDVVAQGATRDDTACVEARRALRAARNSLMETMRATLKRLT